MRDRTVQTFSTQLQCLQYCRTENSERVIEKVCEECQYVPTL